MHPYEIALCVGVAVPLAMFVVLAFFGRRIGKPASGWVAVAGVLVSLLLSTYVLIGWRGQDAGARQALDEGAQRWAWVTLTVNDVEAPADTYLAKQVPILFGVKLDSLTVVMYFMVTLVSTCIFVFSVGYMSGHSDEVDGQSKYHRFFCYLSLFEFSMLGLVISSNLFFLFVFWELVGLCSYLLIGYYFDKKFASDAAIKAFVTNRVGDFGFLAGLMLVFVFLQTTDLDKAAEVFRAQFDNSTGIFAHTVELFGHQISGMTLATLMGIGLFCGAMGKSAQFPLHVWLPDAMAGPTPVSALIHAATMVAAGVYLVARIFRLLTPDAQMFIAVIGCITLTITALVAITQTDIKKVLAYSTLSQLGYMIFGMGVGAWVAALFHLITHAFFKAMLFLGSGQVIEGCHHEQDIRKMGGLCRKMPVTCWTFFVGVLAIAGFGIPGMGIGLGGYFSKDEILAVAYERTYNWDRYGSAHEREEQHVTHVRENVLPSDRAPFGSATTSRDRDGADGVAPGRRVFAQGRPASGTGTKEHGHAGQEEGAGAHAAGRPAAENGHGSSIKGSLASATRALPRWMFWLPIIIAYVTPFYMMRCWWLTFMGKPRDDHVHHHAHEMPLMYVPLVVLAVGTLLSGYLLFRPEIADAGVAAADATAVVALDGEAEHATGTALSLSHEAGRNPHAALIGLVGFAWVVGMALAWLIYRNGLALAERFKRLPGIGFLHMCLVEKLFFDHIYDAVLVGGVKGVLAGISRLFDTYIIDALANLLSKITVGLSSFSGRIVDAGGVDGFIDGLADTAQGIGEVARRPQTGRIRNYVLFGTAGASLVLVALVILVMGM